jgi:prepilin-type N-terminal cleavage/methylation domain-containing protein
MKKSGRGFTLVEIMIVVAIIALLAAISIPGVLRAKVNANDAAAASYMKSLSTALEMYAAGNSARYPAVDDLSALAASDFATSSPPYLQAVQLVTPQFGHEIIFAGSVGGYQIAANTLNDNVSGSKNYRMSTLSVLETQGCDSGDYTVTAP